MGFYRLTQIKLPLDHDEIMIRQQIKKQYGIKGHYNFDIAKQSVDARKKNQLLIVYNIDVYVPKQDESKKLANVKYWEKKPTYQIPMLTGKRENLVNEGNRPVIIGAGPAGLFAGLILAKAGAKPIILERGQAVEQRMVDVENFLTTGKLDTESNIQFGEGGAGTFSDGKINTGVKDRFNRIEEIVGTFIECGAPEAIRYASKPHIGTDYLVEVVKNIREKIIELGGEVRFGTKMKELFIEEGRVKGVCLDKGQFVETNHVVLAIGHSARDTFEVLVKQEVPMEKKAFAVGFRIEHPQEMISRSQYGDNYNHPNLPVADYKLTYRTEKGRGVYSFCMCPGGFVVNSASEEGMVVCNGMSNYARDEINANSAILVNVHPEDFDTNDLLAGVAFQRKWERTAFELAGSNNHLPVQTFGDFVKGNSEGMFGEVKPNTKGSYTYCDLNGALPNFVTEALKEGITAFGRKIKGFDREDAVLTGVETRSSSPVRILRNEYYESPLEGLYPCGEGAGFAGGIMSAALDGIKVAEAIVDAMNGVVDIKS